MIEEEIGPLLMRCRIGHTFTATEFLMGKEERVENLLEETLTAMEELGALLVDLDAAHEPSTTHQQYENRLERVIRQIGGLRRLLDDNRPTVLEEDDHPELKGPR